MGEIDLMGLHRSPHNLLDAIHGAVNLEGGWWW